MNKIPHKYCSALVGVFIHFNELKSVSVYMFLCDLLLCYKVLPGFEL
jgi:hypothetical protein